MHETQLPDAQDRYSIRSVERALAILKLLATADANISGAELGRRLQLPQSTVLRLLVTLGRAQLVEHDPDTGKYRLGVACLELGSAFLRHSDLRSRALGVLQDLRDDTGETVHLAVLAHGEVVYIEKLAGLHPIGLMSSRVGARAPAHCTGVGKVLLAHLPAAQLEQVLATLPLRRFTARTIVARRPLRVQLERVRGQGYAVDNEEHEDGVMCVAAPIFDHQGLAGAISVSGPTERITQQLAQAELVGRVCEAAAAISCALGGGNLVAAASGAAPTGKGDIGD